MTRSYRRAPITEAACEFRFTSKQEWDWTIPGLIYEQVRGAYPVKRQQTGLEVQLAPGTAVSVPLPEGAMNVNKLQFIRTDEQALVQVGPHLLVVNQLRRYPGWEEFRRNILGHLATYREVAKPDSIARVGLRYINRIEIPYTEGSIDFDTYFTGLPRTPQGIPDVWSSFLVSLSVEYTDSQRCSLRYMLSGTQPTDDQHYVVILDLDLFAAESSAPPFDQIEEWLDIAHERIEQAFDASVTDKTHSEVFEEVHAT